MRRLLALALIVGAGAAVAAASNESSAEQGVAGAVPKVLLAIRWQHDRGTLVRLDGRTLRQAARGLPLGRFTSSASFSPDRRQLVLAREQPTALRFVDLTTLRRSFDLPLRETGFATTTAWLTARRLLALVSLDDGGHLLLVVDPVARRIVSRQTIDGRIEQIGRGRERLLLLLAPADRIGAARLLAAGPDGRIETAPLPRTLAGSRKDGSSPLLHGRLPGLAVDADGGRAYVLAAGAPVAEVELKTMHVSYRQLHQQRSLSSRLAAWLLPSAQAKGIAGPQRQALWLGDGVLALTGVDDQTSIDAKGNWHYRFDPAGLTLIDTRTWSRRTIDDRVTTAWRLGPTLLALRSDPGGGPPTLVGYDHGGRLLYTAGLQTNGIVHPAGETAYVETSDNRLVRLDGRTGAILARAPASGLSLIGPATLDGGPWAPLRRALRLKPLAPGARCPATSRRRLDHGRLAGYGAGPVHPTGFSLSTDSRHPGWLASKTIWTWPASLRHKHIRVLVRGIRLDRPGLVRFQLGPNWGSAPLTRELHLDTSQTVGSFSNSDWGTTVTLLFAHQPGCYGLQLDTAAGTSTIVIRLTRTRR